MLLHVKRMLNNTQTQCSSSVNIRFCRLKKGVGKGEGKGTGKAVHNYDTKAYKGA
jgi:hypothetical protein